MESGITNHEAIRSSLGVTDSPIYHISYIVSAPSPFFCRQCFVKQDLLTLFLPLEQMFCTHHKNSS